ncbi:hypothetical protein OAT18_02425 [Tenacibaculum sp.]|nr:hypothetical protein [Tenacibaculum sp.]
MKNSILNLGRVLNKTTQKEINGGRRRGSSCSGSGIGGISTLGHSSACVGKRNGTKCNINGYQAGCTGNGDGFWFY